MKHAERFARAVIDAVDFQLALEGRSWMFRWRMRAVGALPLYRTTKPIVAHKRPAGRGAAPPVLTAF